MGLTSLPPDLAAARPDLAAAVEDANRRARQGRAPRPAPKRPNADGQQPREHTDREGPEQAALVEVLRAAGVLFSASLSGLRLTPAIFVRAKAQGMDRGDPDIVLWASPPALPQCKAMHVELKEPGLAPKTDRADRWSGARPEQRARMEALEREGYLCVVAYGCDDAVRQITAAGYDLTPKTGGAR